MQKITTVIFDLDGTLANTLPLCIQAFRLSIEPLINRPLSDEEIIATFGPSEEGTIMALAPGHYDKGVADYLYYYEKLHHICPLPFAGIKDLLDDLKNKNIRLAMVTGKGQHSTNISLAHFGLADVFEIIETGDPSGPRKAEGIKSVLDIFKSDLQQTIYVGDTTGDIVASRKVGIPVIAAAWAETAEPQKLLELQPDEILYSVADFVTWLKEKI